MILKRLLGAGLIAAGLVTMTGLLLAWPQIRPPVQEQGVTFSSPHASGIGLDWKQTYRAILDDLGVKRLRLNAYWNIIEPDEGRFDFTDLDYQMDEAAKREAQVILSVGRKIPRWPECHVPGWAQPLPEASQQEAVLRMLETTVERYKGHSALKMWQLENEPFLDFGICPPADREFYTREEALVRSLDPIHPILVTDSGELNSWLTAAQFGDIVGTTMYRTVFSERTHGHFFYDYIFPAWGYRLKSRYVKLLQGKEVLISELQGEPWGAKPFPDMTEDERRASFSPERFRELYGFAGRTQLPEAYWWGVEYWYWEKEIQGNGEYWDFAKTYIFRQSLL